MSTRIDCARGNEMGDDRAKKDNKLVMEFLACKLRWYHVEPRLNRSVSAAIANELSCIPQMS